MTGGRDFMMEFLTFVGGSVGLDDAARAWSACEDHPMMWALELLFPHWEYPIGHQCNPF